MFLYVTALCRSRPLSTQLSPSLVARSFKMIILKPNLILLYFPNAWEQSPITQTWIWNTLWPTSSRGILSNLTSIPWYILPYPPPHKALPSPACMVNSYLSSKIQIRHHLCREAWATPLCVSTAPSSVHSSDRTVTTLLGHTETLGAGTLSHLSLPPYYLAQCLAHNEVLWLFRMNDEFNLLTLCFILIYTDQFGNNNLMVDSIFTLKTYSISSFTLVGRTGFVILTYM